jgi:hypothetical protein
MTYKTYTYRVFPNNRGGLWKNQPFQRGDGYGGLWKTQPFQRGDGLASFLGRMARKIVPMVSKVAKKSLKVIKNSDTLKDVGKSLLDAGTEGLAEMAANAIDPRNNQSASETAQMRLDQTRNDIANIIRKKRKEYYDSPTDSDDSLENIPIVKRKRARNKRPKKNPKRKKYDVLKNVKYE